MDLTKLTKDQLLNLKLELEQFKKTVAYSFLLHKLQSRKIAGLDVVVGTLIDGVKTYSLVERAKGASEEIDYLCSLFDDLASEIGDTLNQNFQE